MARSPMLTNGDLFFRARFSMGAPAPNVLQTGVRGVVGAEEEDTVAFSTLRGED